MIWQWKFGKPMSIIIQFVIALFIDQIKAVITQFFIYWIVIRRLGVFKAADFKVWNDEEICEGGNKESLFNLIRGKIKRFLENEKISALILGMTVFLCIAIFSELTLEEQIEQYKALSQFYYILNFFLLTFFVIEIILRLIASGIEFLYEFINAFDSTIVIVSYVFLLMKIEA